MLRPNSCPPLVAVWRIFVQILNFVENILLLISALPARSTASRMHPTCVHLPPLTVYGHRLDGFPVHPQNYPSTQKQEIPQLRRPHSFYCTKNASNVCVSTAAHGLRPSIGRILPYSPETAPPAGNRKSCSSAVFVNSAAPRTRPTRAHVPSLAAYCRPSDGFSRILPKPALHHETTYPAVPALLAVPIHPAHSTASVTRLVRVRGSSVTTYGNRSDGFALTPPETSFRQETTNPAAPALSLTLLHPERVQCVRMHHSLRSMVAELSRVPPNPSSTSKL